MRVFASVLPVAEGSPEPGSVGGTGSACRGAGAPPGGSGENGPHPSQLLDQPAFAPDPSSQQPLSPPADVTPPPLPPESHLLPPSLVRPLVTAFEARVDGPGLAPASRPPAWSRLQSLFANLGDIFIGLGDSGVGIPGGPSISGPQGPSWSVPGQDTCARGGSIPPGGRDSGGARFRLSAATRTPGHGAPSWRRGVRLRLADGETAGSVLARPHTRAPSAFHWAFHWAWCPQNLDRKWEFSNNT